MNHPTELSEDDSDRSENYLYGNDDTDDESTEIEEPVVKRKGTRTPKVRGRKKGVLPVRSVSKRGIHRPKRYEDFFVYELR